LIGFVFADEQKSPILQTHGMGIILSSFWLWSFWRWLRAMWFYIWVRTTPILNGDA